MIKRALLVGIFSALAAGPVNAFQAPFWVNFTPYMATVQISNPYPYPIACYGTLTAMRSDGFTQFGNFQTPYIPYGFSENTYLYTGAPFFFTGAYANFDCEY